MVRGLGQGQGAREGSGGLGQGLGQGQGARAGSVGLGPSPVLTGARANRKS